VSGKASKDKGSNYERDVVKKLNNIYNTDTFRRTPGSGALMGKGNWQKNIRLEDNTRRILASDIITPDWFRFSIECKWYKDSPNYSTIVKGPDTTLDGWITETELDSQNNNLWPMLCFKTNNQGEHVALRKDFLEVISCDYYVIYRDYIIIGMDHFLASAASIAAYGSDKVPTFKEH